MKVEHINKKATCTIIILLISLSTLAPNVRLGRTAPAEIIVPDQYSTIQAAINSANEGDTILVRSGTYYEHIAVNKTVALIGEDPTTTIIDGNNTGHAVTVTRDNVNVSGFTVQRGGNVVLPNMDAGICLNRTSGCNVSGNVVVDDGSFGISLWYSDQNLIWGNNLTRNAVFGVILTGSSGNTVSSNNVLDNPESGIDLHAASHNNIICENMVMNSTYAFILHDARNNTISGNYIADCDEGLWIQAGAGNNTMSGNDLVNNLCGVRIEEQANNCTVSGNIITGSQFGIYVFNARYTEIFGNTIAHNYGSDWDAGIRLESAGYTRMHDNLIADNWRGILLYSASPHVSIYNNNVTSNEYAISVVGGSSYLNVSENLIANNSVYGVGVTGFESASNCVLISRNVVVNNVLLGVVIGNGSNYNTISQNSISENGFGLYIEYSTQNSIRNNNIMNNTQQVYVASGSVNTWDEGYASGGNYWSDHAAIDLYGGFYENETGSDGLADTAYRIDANNVDRFPLMGSFSEFTATPACQVQVISNSTITMFECNGTAISYNVADVEGAAWLCRVGIPAALGESFKVFIDEIEVPSRVVFSNATYTCLYFNFTSSEQETVTICSILIGDVNGDGYVGIDDIFAVASHFGEQPGDPEWNPIYDLLNDDYVGIDDIFTAASHFGEGQ